MARAKRIYILLIEVNKLIFLFASRYFLKENMFSAFLSGYRSTRESLGELKKSSGNTRLWLVFPQHFTFSQTFSRVSIQQLDHEPEISMR